MCCLCSTVATLGHSRRGPKRDTVSSEDERIIGNGKVMTIPAPTCLPLCLFFRDLKKIVFNLYLFIGWGGCVGAG